MSKSFLNFSIYCRYVIVCVITYIAHWLSLGSQFQVPYKYLYMPKLVFVFLCVLVLHLVYILWFKSEPRKNYDTPPCLPLGLDDGLKCKIQTRSAHHSCSMRFYCSKHCCHQFFPPTRHVESVMGAHAPQIFISSKCHRGLFH